MKDRELHIIQKVWTNLCRFALAGVFIFSGFAKAVDPLGSEYKIQDYLDAFGMGTWFPAFFPLLAGIVLSAIEFSVGIMVVFQAAVYLFVFWHPENDCYMVGFVADDFYDTADPVSGFS